MYGTVSGTYILKGGPVDEAQALLDDHIVKSQAMTASPFAKPFEERLFPWERKLVRFQEIIDGWLKCQGKWIYLEPIFGAEEIMKQIPKEGAAFRDMDRTWRRIMAKTKEDPLMLNVADIDMLLEDLTVRCGFGRFVLCDGSSHSLCESKGCWETEGESLGGASAPLGLNRFWSSVYLYRVRS